MSLYHAFVFLFFSTTAGLDDCKTVLSIRNYLLIGHTFKITSGKSLTTCILTCDRDASCYSFNYKFPSKMCELNNVSRYLCPEKLILSPDAVHFDHPLRPAGSCSGNWPCRNRGKCVNLAGAPGFRCRCRYHYTGETCKVCSSPPLGMEDGRVLNHQITASSDGWWLPDLKYYKAKDARLKLQSLSWVSSYMDSTPWLQVSFALEIKLISGIATQGNPSHDWWTTNFIVKHSMTGNIWQEYERQGFTEKFQVRMMLTNNQRKQCGKNKRNTSDISCVSLKCPYHKMNRSCTHLCRCYNCKNTCNSNEVVMMKKSLKKGCRCGVKRKSKGTGETNASNKPCRDGLRKSKCPCVAGGVGCIEVCGCFDCGNIVQARADPRKTPKRKKRNRATVSPFKKGKRGPSS